MSVPPVSNVAGSLVQVRLQASDETIDHVVAAVVLGLCKAGYELVDQSAPYPCRPPRQAQRRIYLTFSDVRR